MEFYTYQDAKKVYDKIAKSNKIQFKTIVENDRYADKIYQKYKNDKDGYHKLSDYGKVSDFSWGYGDNTFEEKTIR